jgi:chorismate dehydratase
MRRIRVSAISFLNTAPLMWDFEHQPTAELTQNLTIRYTLPSRCAEELAEGTADIGIVPVITTSTIPDLVIVPDVAIAARGPVRSILLISKKPIADVRNVAVDTSSRTSVVLLQVLLTKFHGGPREFVAMEPDLGRMLQTCDAALLIGDPALTTLTSNLYVYDLAYCWNTLTKKPFVFAVWAVRKQAIAEGKPGLPIAQIFQRSRDHGLQPSSIRAIALDWSPRLGLPPHDLESYLRDSVYYRLDAECKEGLDLYFKYAFECGLIPKVPRLEYL